MMIRSGIANMADALGRKVAKDGVKLERAVMIDGRKIKTKWVDPDDLEDHGTFDDGEHHWDDTLYINGNLFLDEYANPLDVRDEVEDGEGKLMPSQKFKTAMETKIISDQYGGGRSNKLLKLALVGILANAALVATAIWLLIQGGVM